MTIQINTDHNITGNESFIAHTTAIIEEKLQRHSEHLTRVEVHLSDENGHKTGINDIRCLIEARMEGRQPIAVTTHANDKEQAINTAIDKLKAALASIHDRMKTH